MQESEIFLLTEFWVKIVKLLLTVMGHKLKEFASVNELKITNTFSNIKRFIK